MRFCKYLSIAVLLPFLAASVAFADAYDPPAGFYSTATGQGSTLQNQLTSIMSSGHISRTYGAFRYASVLFDTDPNNSSRIILVYNGASVSGTWDSGSTWNREHVWPQSMQPGSASNSSTGNLGDHHALRPSNPGINSSRGNKPFGNLNSSGVFGAQTGGTYYPGDNDAGDIARALFYSDTRYNSTLANLSGGSIGDIDTLVKWNYVDPPNEFERRRNQVIYSSSLNPSSYQNNRNAFIDHPEYVWSIYGGGNNDSQISVGGAGNPDGSSSTTVDLGRVITGAAVPVAQSVSVVKAGNNPTYYEVSTTGDATSTVSGRYNTFVEGVGITGLNAGLNTSTATAGLKSGVILVNNLDVSTGGAGQGSADADDMISINLDVLDHSDASFASGLDQNLLVIDFGTVPVGGVIDSSFDIFNLEQTLSFTADLDLDSIIGSGDTGTFSTDLASFSGLAGGASNGFLASFDTSSVGTFGVSYTLNLSDEDIAGATSQVLTLLIAGEVTGALAGDLDGDGFVGISDLNMVLGDWNMTLPVFDPPDPSGDGFVGIEDLNIVLGNWNAGTPPSAAVPEPGVGMLMGLAGLSLLKRRRSA